MARLVPRSLAGQTFVLQLVVIAVMVLGGSALAIVDARRDGDAAARLQVTGIAGALAESPATAAAIESGTATAVLQPVTERVRADTQIAFITIMAPDRTRFTHTNPELIGRPYIGTIENSVCWVIPADTSPTTSPDDERTGATARIDGPRVPV